MVMGPERDCGSSLSTTLRRPIASSIDIVERSSRDSIERAICLYFSGTQRKSFSTALLTVGVIAELHHLLQQSVETESKVINVLTWLEGQVLPLLAKCLQCGLAGAVAADACRSDGVPSRLDSPLVGQRELHLGRDCSDEGIQRPSI